MSTLILAVGAVVLFALYALGVYTGASALMLATIAALMAVFFLAGLYVSLGLGLVALSLAALFSDRPLWAALPQIAFNANTSFLLVAIPMFVLMGELLERSGLTEKLYASLTLWLNRIPGGLLHTNIAACAMFSAVSGSSVATAATIGSVALPSFRARGYDGRLVAGSLAAGGTLGILIPPSINMIVYAVLMEVSIGKMYMAGVIPGLVLTGTFMLTIYAAAKLWPAVAPREPGVPWLQRFIALAALVPFVVLVLIVLGTIYLGWATATESAAFGAVGAFLIAAANRRVNLKMLKEALLNTATTTAMIMFIVTAALVLNFVMVHLNIPAALAETVGSLGLSPLAIILALMVLYLVLGTFMDGLAMVLTTLPVLLPVLKALNIDLIWFGILLVIITEAALISPPEGMNLYVLQALRKRGRGASSKETIMDVYVGVMPFLAAIIVTLALVIAFPQIALWLPSMMQVR